MSHGHAPAAAETTPHPHWRVHLTLIVVLQAAAFFAISFNQGYLPFYLREDLNVSDPEELKFLVGVTASASPLMIMVFNPIWGMMADRFGQKPMLVRAMIGTGICMALPAVITEPWQFVVTRFLLGIFTGINAATMGVVSQLVPRDRLAGALGWIQTTRFIGMTSGPAVGGFIGDLMGYRNAYLFGAAVSIGLGLIAWAVLPRTPVVARSGPRMGFVDRIRYVGTQRQIVLLLVFIFLAQLVDFLTLPYLPVLVDDVATSHENIATVAGLVVSAGSISMGLAGVVMGRVADRWGFVRPLIAACLVGCGLQVLFALARSPEQLFALRFAMGFAYGGLLPLATAATGLWTDPRHRGLVFGVVSSAAPASGVVGPLIGSAVATPFGVRAPFLASAVLLIVAAIFTARSLREPPRAEPPSSA